MNPHRTPSVLAPATLRREQADLLRMLAYSYERNGLPARAAVLWLALHALWPADMHIVHSLAFAQLRSDNPEPALTLLDALLDAGAAGALTHLLRSQALVRTGRLAEAARSMRFYVAARAERQRSKEP